MDKAAIVDLLDRHFSGTPTDETERLVEQYRQENPEFQAMYEEYAEAVESIRLFSRAQLKQDLHAYLEQQLAETPIDDTPFKIVSRTYRFSIWQSMAAAFVLLILATGFVFVDKYQGQLSSITPDRMSLAEAGSESDGNEVLQESLSIYLEGIRLSKEASTQKEAIKKLQSIGKEVEYYYFWAQYEIALIFIKQKNSQAAEEQLNAIITEDGQHVVKDYAAQLLTILQEPISALLWRLSLIQIEP